MKKLTRADFFKMIIAFFTLAGLSRWVAACSGGSNDTDNDGGGGGTIPQGDCLNAGTHVNISGNHGHELFVSKADVSAGTEKTYDITGVSGHSHSVTVTAANFTSLASNMQITVTSTPADGAGHTHNVTVSCASA